MDQAADSVDVSNFIHPLPKAASDEEVTGKKRFNHTHHTPARRPLQFKARMEHFQSQVPPQSRCRNVLMPWLRPDAVPRLRIDGLNGWQSQVVVPFPSRF